MPTPNTPNIPTPTTLPIYLHPLQHYTTISLHPLHPYSPVSPHLQHLSTSYIPTPTTPPISRYPLHQLHLYTHYTPISIYTYIPTATTLTTPTIPLHPLHPYIQGFSSQIALPKKSYEDFMKSYDDADLMGCRLFNSISYICHDIVKERRYEVRDEAFPYNTCPPQNTNTTHKYLSYILIHVLPSNTCPTF